MQLRDAVPAQHREPAVGARRDRDARCGSTWSRSTTCPGGEAVPSQKVVRDAGPEPPDAHGPLHVNPYPNTDSPGQTPPSARPATSPTPTCRPRSATRRQRRDQDRDDDEERQVRRRRPGRQPRRRDARGGRDRRRLLPRVRRHAAVLRLAVPAQGGVHTQTQLHIPSPVRIAGVEVGEVVACSGSTGSRRRGRDDGHRQQRAADPRRRHRQDPPADLPRGQLLRRSKPGTPSAPVAGVGLDAAGPATRRARCSSTGCCPRSPPTRGRTCRPCCRGSAASLERPPTAAQDATQDPSVRGLTGGQALNLSLKYSAGAFRASAIVNQALLGIEPHDLAGVVIGNEQVFRALAASGQQLASFVNTFNTTMAALASRQQRAQPDDRAAAAVAAQRPTR